MNTETDFSYFRLTLLDFLKQHHPELVEDQGFINGRCEAAEEAYTSSFSENGTNLYSIEMANKALFENLEFSKFDMIHDIIIDEFSIEVPEYTARTFALRMLVVCETIFKKYPVGKDGEVNNLDNLYTELTGTIQIYIEENGI